MTNIYSIATAESEPVKVEEWREIPGSDGRYEVSDQGRLRAWFYRRGGKRQSEARVIKTYVSHVGYESCKLILDGKPRSTSVHRMVMLAFVGPSELDVNHINGDKVDNRLCNLQYMTHSENIRHAIDVLGKKLGARGERSRLAKLSDDQVGWLRRLAADGYTSEALTKIFDISHNHVSVLRNNHARVPIESDSFI